MGRAGARLAEEQRRDVEPVDRPLGQRRADEARDRGKDVDRHGRLADDRPGRDVTGPAGHEGHAHAALERGALPLAQRPGRPRVVAVGEPRPVVGSEDDERVPLEAQAPERREHPAHRVVDLLDHVAVEALLRAPAEGLGREDRHVRHRVGEVDEEGALAVRLDEGHGAPAVLAGQLRLVGVHREHGVARVERQRRELHPLRVARPHVVRVGEAEVVVEAVARREKRRQVPEVPLAVDRGRVAAALQHLGERRLAFGDADLRSGEERSQDADAVRVGAGEQRRARGRADGLRDVEVGEAHALGGQPVDVRRSDARRAVDADVAVPEVVRVDEDDVRRARRVRLGAGSRRDSHEGSQDQCGSLLLHAADSSLSGTVGGADP